MLFQLLGPVWGERPVVTRALIGSKTYTQEFFQPSHPGGNVFALVRIVCVCRYVFKDERSCTISRTHARVMVKRLVFHTVHSLKPFVLLELTAYGKATKKSPLVNYIDAFSPLSPSHVASLCCCSVSLLCMCSTQGFLLILSSSKT